MTISGTPNIASALTEMARTRPYATAVACPAGRDRGGRAAYTFQTFQQLDRESDLLARGLSVVGIGRNVRTALMVKPGHEFFSLVFALFKAGAVPVLIDPGIGLKHIGKCLDEARPGGFVGIPAAEGARRMLGWAKRTVRVAVTVRPDDGRGRVPPLPDLSPARRRGPDPRVSRYFQEVARDPGIPDINRLVPLSLAQVRQAGRAPEAEHFEAAAPIPGATDAILFTSGSTGPPKGVVYSHAIFNAQVEMLREQYAIEPGEIDLCTFPLFALFAPALGMTSVVPEMDASRPARVDPTKIIAAIQTFGATNMFGSPALLKRVSDFGAERGIKLPSLRRVISAGAPVSAQVIEQVSRMLEPGVQVFTPYGATESLPIASIGSDEILHETRHCTDKGAGVCVGRPVSGMRVEAIRIVDTPIPSWSDDLIVVPGSVGELAVYGPVVTSEYFDNPRATALAKIAATGPDDPPGAVWHRTGDVGYLDAQGRIWFCGRKSHRVLASEGTLYTIPTEAIFNMHPLVSRTALVGVGSPGRARPVLCVELKPGMRSKRDRERIRDELLVLGSKHAHTRRIADILFHRSFPVDVRHNAKIFREKLAVWAARRIK
jgi:acyl-CoA synthetase (AMP-forming)/AMP-acid ligase II